MTLKTSSIALTTSLQTVYTCPGGVDASVHGVVISNTAATSATFSLVFVRADTTTITLADTVSVAPDTTFTWPRPINMQSGEAIRAVASAGSTLIIATSIYEGATTAQGFNPKGAWSSSTPYNQNDVVSYNGASYVASQASTNQQPDTATTYWTQLVAPSTISTTTATTISGLLKGSGGFVAAATAGADYVAPSGALGTPSSGTLTNCTSLPISTGVSGLGTGVATALSVNTGSAGAVVLFNGALGTPSSGTLTNATGLPISTGVSGLGTGVATFLATPTSANLDAAVPDSTGSGALVFATSPTLVTPILGTPTSGNLSNCTADGTNKVGYRNIPRSGTAKNTSYTLATTDVGEYIEITTGGSIVVPDATFAAGDVVSVFNNTSAGITMTMSITTAYIGGTDADKATITVATRGLATILFISGTVCVVSGNVS